MGGYCWGLGAAGGVRYLVPSGKGAAGQTYRYLGTVQHTGLQGLEGLDRTDLSETM